MDSCRLIVDYLLCFILHLDHFDWPVLIKVKTYSYYQGIVSWILDFFQPSSFSDAYWHPDNIAADTLMILQDRIMKSMAKFSGKKADLSAFVKGIDYLDQDYENDFRDYFEESICKITGFSYDQNFPL